jgi:hypothetical protein
MEDRTRKARAEIVPVVSPGQLDQVTSTYPDALIGYTSLSLPPGGSTR